MKLFSVRRVLRHLSTLARACQSNFRYGYVSKSYINQLRQYLDELGRVDGMRSDEKDPEEFLNLLLTDVFHHKPSIELR